MSLDKNKFVEDFNEMKQDSREFYVLEITSSDQCTMRCSYCFEKGCGYDKTKTLNSDMPNIIEKIDLLLEDEKFNDIFRGIQLDFWGGEPTMNMLPIQTLVEKYKNCSKIRFHIYTNGFVVKKFLNLLEENKDVPQFRDNFSIQISYDGNPIHDKNRISFSGGATSKEVLNNFDAIVSLGYSPSFKATLTPEDFKYLPDVWEDYNFLHSLYKEKGVKINYAPTIDYLNNYSEHYLEDFKKAIIEVAKKEVHFYKREGRYLMTWFRGGRGKFECSAGRNIASIDTSGNGYVCHGAHYIDDAKVKDSLYVFSIYDKNEDFINKIINQYYNMLENGPEKYVPKECASCEATTCLRCNTSKFVHSSKEGFFNKWYDYLNQKTICSYFKFFGKVDRATIRILED